MSVCPWSYPREGDCWYRCYHANVSSLQLEDYRDETCQMGVTLLQQHNFAKSCHPAFHRQFEACQCPGCQGGWEVPFQRQHGLWNRLCDMETRNGWSVHELSNSPRPGGIRWSIHGWRSRCYLCGSCPRCWRSGWCPHLHSMRWYCCQMSCQGQRPILRPIRMNYWQQQVTPEQQKQQLQ